MERVSTCRRTSPRASRRSSLTGERTLPDVPEENYWFRRHLVVYEWIAARAHGRRVVDLACGEGYGSAVLGRTAASVVGVDANPEAFEHARLKYTRENVRFERTMIELWRGDADCVVFLQTIEHVQDPDAVMEAIREQIGPGGVAYVSTPNVLTLAPKGAERSGNPWHVHEYRPEEFAALCSRHFSARRHARASSTRASCAPTSGRSSTRGWDDVHRALRLHGAVLRLVHARDLGARLRAAARATGAGAGPPGRPPSLRTGKVLRFITTNHLAESPPVPGGERGTRLEPKTGSAGRIAAGVRRSAGPSASPTANPVGPETRGIFAVPNVDPASHEPWLESKRRSRARRAEARKARRTRPRRARPRPSSRALSLTVAAGGAVAPGRRLGQRQGGRLERRRRCSRALGIAADGIYGPQTRAAVRRFQRNQGLAVDGIAGPATLGALGLSGSSVQSTPTRPRPARRRASRSPTIAQCESGGDPTAVSPGGQYRGKYQFSRATWREHGRRRATRAAASEAEQDRIAAKLYAARGTPAVRPSAARTSRVTASAASPARPASAGCGPGRRRPPRWRGRPW